MKKINIHIVAKSNSQITIVGQDRGAIDAHKVESIYSFNEPTAVDIITSAKAEGRYVPFISENEKIKTIIMTIDGRVYPSSFSIDTLKKRIKEATDIMNQNIGS